MILISLNTKYPCVKHKELRLHYIHKKHISLKNNEKEVDGCELSKIDQLNNPL